MKLPLDEPLPCDWDNTQSFAGLWPGKHWAWSVPFYLVPAAESSGPLGTRKACPVRVDAAAASIYIAFAPTADGGTVKLQSPEGKQIAIQPADCAVGWQSWPPCFHRKVLLGRVTAASIAAGLNAVEMTVVPEGAYLLAITQLVDRKQEEHVAEVFHRGQVACHAALAEDAKLRKFRALSRAGCRRAGSAFCPALRGMGLWRDFCITAV